MDPFLRFSHLARLNRFPFLVLRRVWWDWMVYGTEEEHVVWIAQSEIWNLTVQ